MQSIGSSDAPNRITLVGAGRLGKALAPALVAAGVEVLGPLVRDADFGRFQAGDVVLLTVPDDAIASVAASIPVGPVVGHCSGALTLDALGAHQGFSLHPLLSVTDKGTRFDGAACAIAGRSEHALATALWLAKRLGMEAVEVPDEARSLYHAAASVASNYLVTLEDAADQLAASTGIERRHLSRLAQSALDNWTRLGGPGALTGPIVRGDEATVQRQRDAVERAAAHLLPLWDALADATRAVAKRHGKSHLTILK
jgi:predicted short-subunit dehydrogenase-like oxidoreductase (DUF2520 family)